MKMRTKVLPVLAALGLAACAPSLADDVDLENVAPDDIAWIGETPIYPTATIAENLASAGVFSHLAVLVDRVGLDETLGEAGPYTIFAPTDDGFDDVSPAVRESLAQPENAEKLRKAVASHVFPGKITYGELTAHIVAGGGSYQTVSLAGTPVTFREERGSIRMSSGKQAGALLTQADLYQANGIMHVVDEVLLPGS